MGRLDQDEDGDEQERDKWVIVEWVAWYDLRLVGIVEVDGKPRVDHSRAGSFRVFYKWHSYRAAKKFLDAHPELAGSQIMNLSAIIRSHRECHERDRKS